MPKSKAVKVGTGVSSRPPTVPDPRALLPPLTRKQAWELVPRELFGDRLITVTGVLSHEECVALVAAAERIGFEHQGSRGAAYGEAYRDNHRIAVQSEHFAEQLWRQTGLCDVCAALRYGGRHPVGLNPNIRLYRYSPKQKFGRHVDESVCAGGGVTGYTLLVYLTAGAGQRGGGGGGLQGGETVFYDERGRRLLAVAPAVGMALLHLHGDECLEHEGAEVVRGTKYILRSDVVFR